MSSAGPFRLLPDADRPAAEAVGALVYANPFLPERIDRERAALGDAFTPGEVVWSAGADFDTGRANVAALSDRAEALAGSMRRAVASAGAAARAMSGADRRLYEDVACYALYYRVQADLRRVVERGARAGGVDLRDLYGRFAADHAHFFRPPGAGDAVLSRHGPDHLFALFFQLRRAFVRVFGNLVGGSLPIARLRASVWQSVFTHDVRRYAAGLHARMNDFTTLVTGPSGTGKELVARAVALSRYVPFDPRTATFAADPSDAAGGDGSLFVPINLSALSPALIESELFGHRRGSFTGATADRAGYLETCPDLGCVFLDEIGELGEPIQVKLLRVLQDRAFARTGETRPRRFAGKLIAATNRDLPAEMAAGRFRSDFYYRLCSDLIRTPSLREQIDDAGTPGGGRDELRRLVGFIARRVAGDEGSSSLADEVCEVIARDLGDGYGWPGNFRELEQCVRNVLIRRRYDPPREASVSIDAADRLAGELRSGSLSADALLGRYVALVYADAGTYEETGRRLGLDRRTIKAKLEAARGGGSDGEAT